MSDWEARFDVASGAYYYYNNKSDISVWQRPRDYISSRSDFEQRFDDSQGAHYYVDLTTGESTWERPACMGLSPVVDPPPPAQEKGNCKGKGKGMSMREYLATKKIDVGGVGGEGGGDVGDEEEGGGVCCEGVHG